MVVQIEYNWYDDVKSTDHSSSILTLQKIFFAISIQKLAFASHSATDELSAFLQQCKEIPSLDLFSSENSMDVTAAMVWLCLWLVVTNVLKSFGVVHEFVIALGFKVPQWYCQTLSE